MRAASDKAGNRTSVRQGWCELFYPASASQREQADEVGGDRPALTGPQGRRLSMMHHPTSFCLPGSMLAEFSPLSWRRHGRLLQVLLPVLLPQGSQRRKAGTTKTGPAICQDWMQSERNKVPRCTTSWLLASSMFNLPDSITVSNASINDRSPCFCRRLRRLSPISCRRMAKPRDLGPRSAADTNQTAPGLMLPPSSAQAKTSRPIPLPITRSNTMSWLQHE